MLSGYMLSEHLVLAVLVMTRDSILLEVVCSIDFVELL